MSGSHSFLFIAIHPENISAYYEPGTVLGIGDTTVMETKLLLSWNAYTTVCVYIGGGHIIKTYGNFS